MLNGLSVTVVTSMSTGGLGNTLPAQYTALTSQWLRGHYHTYLVVDGQSCAHLKQST